MENNYSAHFRDNLCSIPSDILDDLSSRFIINVPDEERNDPVRICFQIELAHWFYLDFYCVESPSLPSCSIKEFIHIIFHHIPSLHNFANQADSIFMKWRDYKRAVPTFGAILLDEKLEYVLLVQSYFGKSSWSFPKGKVNEEEEPHDCAVREVFEETGCDISKFIVKDQFLEHHFNEQLIRLYIVKGIPKDTKFQPQTRNEIRKVEWFRMSDIPYGKRKPGSGSSGFFLVGVFMKPLKKWINNLSKHSDGPSNDQPDSNKQRLKVQQLFARVSANEMMSFLQEDAPPPPPQKAEPVQKSELMQKSNRKHAYTPPPRMLKQMAQNQRKSFRQSPDMIRNKNYGKDSNSFAYVRRSLAESFEAIAPGFSNNSQQMRATNDVHNPVYWRSSDWDNFRIDREVLVASFNIGLRRKFMSV